MTNSLSAVMPKILARGLLALREQAVMPRLVNSDYSTDAAEKGDTIDIPVPSVIAASDVAPSATLTDPADVTASKVSVSLSNWKKAGFHLSDKDLMNVESNNSFVPMQLSEAVRALANEINTSIHQQYKGIYGVVGSDAAVPFASTVGDAVNARKVLHQQRAPRENRRAVLNFDAEANMLALSQFSDVDKAGDLGPKIEGMIGRKYGFDWFADDGVLTHTAGTLSANTAGDATINSSASVGATSLDIASTAGGTFVEGDIFTIAGDSQTYVVTAGVTIGSSSNATVTIQPALQVAVSGTEILTIKDSHVVNMAFHRDAFAFAARPLYDATMDIGLGNEIMMLQDPQTGMILRLELSRQNKRTVWELDALWGAKLVRPELACRIIGQA